MRKIHAIILAASVTLSATTAFAQQTAVAPPVHAAAQTKSSAKVSEAEALAMMAKGDNWAGTNALKSALVKNDTPLNRFNLATGYQRTGRVDQAQTLYQGLLKTGRTTNAIASTPGFAEPSRMFNLADEAASRLLYIAWLKKSGHAPQSVARSSNAPSATGESFASDASATVGGPTHGDVSDAQALALDSLVSKAP